MALLSSCVMPTMSAINQLTITHMVSMNNTYIKQNCHGHSNQQHIVTILKNSELYQHRPQIAQANLSVINIEKGAAENGVTLRSIFHRNGTQQWHRAMAPSNGTPAWHPAMATQQWHPTWTPPKLVASFQQWHPAMAPSHATPQWHPAMAPQQWHPAMTPQQWNPAMAPSIGQQWHPMWTPPKLVPTPPPVGSKNPYS